MKITDQLPMRHSAIVLMELRINGFTLPVSHLGPNFLIAKDSVEHPPTDAEIFLSVDGNERSWQVHLPDGISKEKQKTAISRCRDAKGPQQNDCG